MTAKCSGRSLEELKIKHSFYTDIQTHYAVYSKKESPTDFYATPYRTNPYNKVLDF